MVVVGFVVLTTYNAVVALRNRIRKAWANIDVALKQRHDMLPGLVDAVRGIMAFEQDVFEVLTLEGSVAARDHVGGTAPNQVRAAIVRVRQQLAE